MKDIYENVDQHSAVGERCMRAFYHEGFSPEETYMERAKISIANSRELGVMEISLCGKAIHANSCDPLYWDVIWLYHEQRENALSRT